MGSNGGPQQSHTSECHIIHVVSCITAFVPYSRQVICGGVGTRLNLTPVIRLSSEKERSLEALFPGPLYLWGGGGGG